MHNYLQKGIKLSATSLASTMLFTVHDAYWGMFLFDHFWSWLLWLTLKFWFDIHLLPLNFHSRWMQRVFQIPNICFLESKICLSFCNITYTCILLFCSVILSRCDIMWMINRFKLEKRSFQYTKFILLFWRSNTSKHESKNYLLNYDHLMQFNGCNSFMHGWLGSWSVTWVRLLSVRSSRRWMTTVHGHYLFPVRVFVGESGSREGWYTREHLDMLQKRGQESQRN